MNETFDGKVALVTGANRGMGLETCRALAQRGYQVVLTSRDQRLGQQATQSFVQQGLSVTYFTLDVTDEGSIQHLKRALEERFGGVDVLVNNAAVYPEEGRSVLEVELETFRATMETNFYGPLLLCQAWVPGMIRRSYGRVVNVSSGAGQLATMGDYAPAYSVSKAALNALTCMVADAARGANVLVNAVDPGWVRTRMGGPAASRSIEQGSTRLSGWPPCQMEDPPGDFSMTANRSPGRPAIKWPTELTTLRSYRFTGSILWMGFIRCASCGGYRSLVRKSPANTLLYRPQSLIGSRVLASGVPEKLLTKKRNAPCS